MHEGFYIYIYIVSILTTQFVEPGIDITLPYTYPPIRYDVSIVLSDIFLAGIRYHIVFYIIPGIVLHRDI